MCQRENFLVGATELTHLAKDLDEEVTPKAGMVIHLPAMGVEAQSTLSRTAHTRAKAKEVVAHLLPLVVHSLALLSTTHQVPAVINN